MNPIIEASQCRFAIFLSALGSCRLWGTGCSIAAIAVMMHPTFGAAQWWSANGRIDAGVDLRRYSSYTYGVPPLRPSDVSHVLRDWGLRLLSGPTRSATSYQAIVRDDAGQELFVAVDPYDGRILNLDLTDRALGIASFPRSDADERSSVPGGGLLPRSAKPPTTLSQHRPQARVSTWLSPHLAPSMSTSRRLATVDHRVQIRGATSFATTVARGPNASGVSIQPRVAPTPDQAATLKPIKAQSATRDLRASSPIIAPARDISTSARPEAPPVPKSPTIEKEQRNTLVPADAGFD